jgi:hypothetical protein
VTDPDSLPVVVHDGLQSTIHGTGAGVGQVRQVVLPAHVGTGLHLKENITYRRQSKKPSVKKLGITAHYRVGTVGYLVFAKGFLGNHGF